MFQWRSHQRGCRGLGVGAIIDKSPYWIREYSMHQQHVESSLLIMRTNMTNMLVQITRIQNIYVNVHVLFWQLNFVGWSPTPSPSPHAPTSWLRHSLYWCILDFVLRLKLKKGTVFHIKRIISYDVNYNV